MPRKPRLDCPGLLYHTIARGIERGIIFKDDKDKDFFVSRMGDILNETKTFIFAFSLLPNHFHLLLLRGETPISTVMQRLQTGYAMHFNKRHKRCGHLFQNRYKAIICEKDQYFLELVRYIHLNPLRAGLVESIASLPLYPYSGHAYILGRQKAIWFNPDQVLSYFGGAENEAKQRYLEFVFDGALMGRRRDLVGGGLKRSLGYPKEYPKVRLAYDDRLLGSSNFVEEILSKLETDKPKERLDFEALLLSACKKFSTAEEEITGLTKKKDVADARAYIAFRAQKEAGVSASDIARRLRVTKSAAAKMIKRGKEMFGG